MAFQIWEPCRRDPLPYGYGNLGRPEWSSPPSPGGCHSATGRLSPVFRRVGGCYQRLRQGGTGGGAALFYAYGVINDQVQLGRVVRLSRHRQFSGRDEGADRAGDRRDGNFASELTVTNLSDLGRRTLRFPVLLRCSADCRPWTSFYVDLENGEQQIIPISSTRCVNRELWASDRRDGHSPGRVCHFTQWGYRWGRDRSSDGFTVLGGGQYGVFYHAFPMMRSSRRVPGSSDFSKTSPNRSNLALVNAGEFDNTSNVFSIDIFDGETGQLVQTITTRPIAPHRRVQLNGILGTYAPGTTQGYVHIRRISGHHPFLAYGVVNDGAAPGERSGDGAYIPAQK